MKHFSSSAQSGRKSVAGKSAVAQDGKKFKEKDAKLLKEKNLKLKVASNDYCQER